MAISAVIIDSREPENIKSLNFDGLPVSIATLPHGDLIAVCDDGCTIEIERKTPDDLLNSLKDERLMMQLGKMAIEREEQLLKVNKPTSTYWPYLVISGFMYPSSDGHVITQRGVTGWMWSSVQGALTTIQEMGIFVIQCNGDGDYEDCIKRLGNRERKKDLLILPPRPANILDPRSAFIAGLPGVGVEHTLKIMAWAGNLPAHALIGVTDLNINCPIGLSARKKIRMFLGLQDSEGFEIINNQAIEVTQDMPVIQTQLI